MICDPNEKMDKSQALYSLWTIVTVNFCGSFLILFLKEDLRRARKERPDFKFT